MLVRDPRPLRLRYPRQAGSQRAADYALLSWPQGVAAQGDQGDGGCHGGRDQCGRGWAAIRAIGRVAHAFRERLHGLRI